jgi:hypothetical protein
MPARIGVLHDKGDVTARPVAQPLQKILAGLSWALAHARRLRVSWRLGRCGLRSLPITPLLFAVPLPSTLTVPITPPRLDAPPTPRRLPTTCAAIARLGMGRTKGPFTAFEKTTPTSITTTRLLPCPTEMMQ